MELDRIDCEIVAALQKNGRMPNKNLAEAVGVAESTCLTRVRRLVERRVLTGFHADVEPRAVGVGLQAMIAIELLRHSREQVEAFRAHVLDLPEVVRLYHMAGASDYMVHVAVRDAEHLQELTMESFTTRPEVARMQTALIFDQVDTHKLPILVEPEEW